MLATDDRDYAIGIPFAPGLSIAGTSTDRPTWKTILRRDGCAYCGRPKRGKQRHGRPETIEADHVEPRSAGGPASLVVNATGCCVECNRSKRSTPLLHFLLERGTVIA